MATKLVWSHLRPNTDLFIDYPIYFRPFSLVEPRRTRRAVPDSSLRAIQFGTVRCVVCASPGDLSARSVPQTAHVMPAAAARRPIIA